MNNNNFYEQRNIENLKKINALLSTLPLFVSEYITGIENNTSTLSRLNYTYDLRIFFDFMTIRKNVPLDKMTVNFLDTITYSDIQLFMSYLNCYEFNGKIVSCKENAKARKLSSIRAMYKYFFNCDKIKSNVASKIPTPKIHEKEIIRLEVNEVKKLLEFAESNEAFDGRQKAFHDKTKVRDTAILTLFLGTGIRISELIGLNVDDFDFENNSFIVTRKGGNKTILYFTDEVKEALLDWLEMRKANEEISPEETALFVSLQNKRIAIRTVEVLVKKYCKEVVPLKKITPHKLRSTFGTNLYTETGDIYAVADILGHKDVNTTRKHYANIDRERRRNAIKDYRLK